MKLQILMEKQISTNLTWNCEISDVEKTTKRKSMISLLSQFKNYQNRFRNHGEILENVSLKRIKKLLKDIWQFLYFFCPANIKVNSNFTYEKTTNLLELRSHTISRLLEILI